MISIVFIYIHKILEFLSKRKILFSLVLRICLTLIAIKSFIKERMRMMTSAGSIRIIGEVINIKFKMNGTKQYVPIHIENMNRHIFNNKLNESLNEVLFYHEGDSPSTFNGEYVIFKIPNNLIKLFDKFSDDKNKFIKRVKKNSLANDLYIIYYFHKIFLFINKILKFIFFRFIKYLPLRRNLPIKISNIILVPIYHNGNFFHVPLEYIPIVNRKDRLIKVDFKSEYHEEEDIFKFICSKGFENYIPEGTIKSGYRYTNTNLDIDNLENFIENIYSDEEERLANMREKDIHMIDDMLIKSDSH